MSIEKDDRFLINGLRPIIISLPVCDLISSITPQLRVFSPIFVIVNIQNNPILKTDNGFPDLRPNTLNLLSDKAIISKRPLNASFFQIVYL